MAHPKVGAKVSLPAEVGKLAHSHTVYSQVILPSHNNSYAQRQGPLIQGIQPAMVAKAAGQTHGHGAQVFGLKEIARIVASEGLLLASSGLAIGPKEALQLIHGKAASGASTISHQSSGHEALKQMQKSTKGFLAITKGKALSGVVGEMDFVKLLESKAGIKVSEVMSRKVFSVRPTTSLRDVAHMVAKGGYSRLAVAEKGILLGAVTAEALLDHWLVSGSSLGKTSALVQDIMVQPLTIGPKADILEAAKIMGSGLPWVPVESGPELVGVITKRDILDVLEAKV